MTSVQTPPLSRSGSSPCGVGLVNRSGPTTTPPKSLSLRSSYNQLLGRDVIKESMETGSSATLPRSRQRHTMTSLRSVTGTGDSLSSKNQPVSKGRGLPIKSSSSSALYTSCSSSSNTANPKLAKNGANMQRRAESQQLELSRANTESKIHNDPINNPDSDWLEFGKDNSQLPPFRRRTKSFLEYQGKGWDLDVNRGNKEETEEKKLQPSPEKEQASSVKERESHKEEKHSSKQSSPEEKEEVEPVVEVDEEEDEPTPPPRPPLLPVVVEAPLSPTSSSSSTNSPQWEGHNHVPYQTPSQLRDEVPAQVPGSPRSPAKPPRSSQPRVIKVELHPNNENQFLQQYPPSSPKQARSSEKSTPTKTKADPALSDSQPEGGPPKVGLRMDLTPESPSEDEDSSWTTLSQETPSPQTPQETDVWVEGNLPPGWREISDSSEIYFWHIPTGTTQYDRPVAPGNQRACSGQESEAEHNLQKETQDALKPPNERPSSLISDSSVEPVPWSSGSSPSSSSTPSNDIISAECNPGSSISDGLKDYPVYPDPSLKAFEGATLRYASLNLNPPAQLETVDLNNSFSDPEAMENWINVGFAGTFPHINTIGQSFPVRSLGWVEMAERDLCEGRSSVAVHHCIRQLSYCRRDIRDSAGVWGEGKGMLLVLQDHMLNLVDPDDSSLLHSQPISSIRVWGVGRDHDRDFAYVARDKNTRVLKCHVFRCDTPAAAIATSLHEICSKEQKSAPVCGSLCVIMAERKSAKAAAGSSSQNGSDVPLQEFPMPKTELVQKFHVFYLGMTSVTRPIGMDVINGAIDTLISSTGKEDWTPVILSIADTTVAVIKEKEEEEEALVECRVRFLSFMGVGRDVHTFAFIMDTGNQHFQCHVFWCDPNAGCVSEAVQAACVLRYQKCLVARPPPQRAGSSSSSPSPSADSVTRRVSVSVKRGVQSLIDTLKTKKQPSELPQQ